MISDYPAIAPIYNLLLLDYYTEEYEPEHAAHILHYIASVDESARVLAIDFMVEVARLEMTRN